MNVSTTSERTLPPPKRTRFLFAQPPASVMPMPKIRPPTSSDSHGSTGRCGTDFARSTCPAYDSRLVPTMATAIASSHIRMRPQWPMLTMSDSAPIVQKLVLAATRPKTKAIAKPPPTTRVPMLAVVVLMRSPHAPVRRGAWPRRPGKPSFR